MRTLPRRHPQRCARTVRMAGSKTPRRSSKWAHPLHRARNPTSARWRSARNVRAARFRPRTPPSLVARGHTGNRGQHSRFARRLCFRVSPRPCTGFRRSRAGHRWTSRRPPRRHSRAAPEEARALHFRSSRRACHRCVPRMPAHVRRSPHARKSPPGAYPRTLCGYPNSRVCSASSSPRVHSGALTPLRSYSRISSSRGPSSGCQHSTRSAVTVHTCLANALKDVMSPSSGMASGSAAPQQCKVWSLVSAHE